MSQVLALRCEERRRPQSRTDTRRPYGAKDHANGELPEVPGLIKSFRIGFGPIHDRSQSGGESRLRRGHDKQKSQADKEGGGHEAKEAAIQADGKSDECHKQANGNE